MTAAERKIFCDVLYSAQEIIFTYHGRKYCIQGYHENDKAHMYLAQWEPECDNPIIWETTDSIMRKCGKQFQEARLFDGKTFWEVEPDITWVDE